VRLDDSDGGVSGSPTSRIILIARFHEQLPIDFLKAISSRGADLVQMADLFTGSVNRVTNPPNPPPAHPHAKDRFATYFLNAVGWLLLALAT
jgi:hypothetical protein